MKMHIRTTPLNSAALLPARLSPTHKTAHFRRVATRFLPKASTCVAITTVAVLFLVSRVGAQASSRVLPFQGRLADANGNAVPDGTRIVQFKIYDAPVGGRAVWSGEVQNLTINAGLVSTLLGSKASLASVDFNQDLYLELTVDANGDGQITLADPPLLPRQSIVPAVFSQESANSRLLNGYDWSVLFGSNNPVDGTLTSAKIQDNAVTSAKIANGAVTRPKLDVSGATAGQTLRFNGTELVWTNLHSLDAADGSPVDALSVDKDGHVGINTPDPQGASLAVNGGVRARGGPPGGLGVNNNGYAFSGNGGDNDSGMFSSTDGQLQFFTDSAERMRITDFGVGIFGANVLEFGADVTDKEPNAGKIGYRTFSGDSLDIVGAGAANARRIDFFAEAGSVFTGPVAMNDHGIFLRALGDGNHYLAWANALGNQTGFDGPALVGNAGGVLGTRGGSNWSLRWNSNGTVATRSTLLQGSDRNIKENFITIDPQEILTNVLALPITRWNYKDDPIAPHIGPVAQDFHAAFGLGSDDKFIAMVDEEGVALAAIKGLNQKVEDKDGELRALLREQAGQIKALQAELETLKAGGDPKRSLPRPESHLFGSGLAK
jgi:hypothetical protein